MAPAAVKVPDVPVQIVTESTVVTGKGFTTTAVVGVQVIPPPVVTVTVYVPPIAAVAAGRVGF